MALFTGIFAYNFNQQSLKQVLLWHQKIVIHFFFKTLLAVDDAIRVKVRANASK